MHYLHEENGHGVFFSGKTASTRCDVSVILATLSADSLVRCPVEAVLRSIITISNGSILYRTVLVSVLCTSTENDTIYVWDMKDNCEQGVFPWFTILYYYCWLSEHHRCLKVPQAHPMLC